MVVENHPPALHIVIVGAGIAGLTAAIALGKQGHHVEVQIPMALSHSAIANASR